MNRLTFSKYEALGNDFILIDETQHKSHGEPATTITQRRALCDRKRGVGADGVITLLAPLKDGSAVFMHVTNADGSVPQNCGNGLRCVARWLLDNKKMSEGQTINIDTLSGPKSAVVEGEMPKVELGRPQVDLKFNSVDIASAVARFSKECDVAKPELLAFVELGNPHVVFETPDIELAQEKLGPKIEKVFASGVNVSFVNVVNESEILIRVWERGAGATDACGSGAGASVAALIEAKKIKEGTKVRAHFKNGEVTVQTREQRPLVVTLCGPARKRFSGIWESPE